MKLKDKLRDNKRIQKLKEYKESYDNLMSNPRTSAGIKLGIWFVVILIISLIVNLSSNNDYVEPSIESKKKVEFSNTSNGVKEYFSSIDSYQANVSFYKGDMVKSYLVTCKDKCIINIDGNKYYYHDIIKNDNIVDTMGAGDAYISGFIYGLLNNKDINECMYLGSKKASETLSFFGAFK